MIPFAYGLAHGPGLHDPNARASPLIWTKRWKRGRVAIPGKLAAN